MTALRLMAYYGQRSIEQVLAIPPQCAGQSAAGRRRGGARYGLRRPGCALDPSRRAGRAGLRVRARRQRRLSASAPDRLREFIGNQLGVKGALRRDEDDNVRNVAEYAQWYWHVADRWALLLGLRHDEVRFDERDRYITAQNPDDSGSVATKPPRRWPGCSSGPATSCGYTPATARVSRRRAITNSAIAATVDPGWPST